ncbi:MAG: tRNA 2-selenouridine(34) synthase MnmH [Hydrogenophilaceae bacterium]|nr:tRNA 2-selenouridine(34) synthase MnmH [Hydrogenophilaceae bacterium]
MNPSGTATLAHLSEYSEIIDARTPAEFAEDHIPGAINLPVLDDEERVRVGTLHKQVSPFEAKKVGAALVSRHIAEHLETHFHDKPAGYKPLIYCWRGGNRSGSMAHVLQKVGFKAAQLDGGYKAYRRTVITELEQLPGHFGFEVICGPTGCGKSRLLRALSALGAQVLDLESLAVHRGSLLGRLPGQLQPSQKRFESRIWWQLRQFDPAKPVFVESESKKIGNLRVPDALLTAMRGGKGVWIEAVLDQRVTLLLEEYGHFLDSPEILLEQIAHLLPLRGHEVINRWRALIENRQWKEFVRDMLLNHYDPAYMKSLGKNYGSGTTCPAFSLAGVESSDFDTLSGKILESSQQTNEN